MLFHGEVRLKLEFLAKRRVESKGKETTAKLSFGEISANPWGHIITEFYGDNEEHLGDQYADRLASLGGVGERGGPVHTVTSYTGRFTLDSFEIYELFEHAVDTSQKSDDLKRVCKALVKELRRSK